MSLVIARSTKRESSSSTGCEVDEKVPKSATTKLETCSESPELGNPHDERRFWFQRSKTYDPNAIATQPSVFDDPTLADEYRPRSDWENIHRFDPSARWTWREESKVVKKIDFRITLLACLMYMALELDRSNIQQANADNFLADLRLSRDDYNLGNTLFRLGYLLAEFPAQLIGKWVGPDRYVPFQMISWSITACCQFWLSGRTSFLICRTLLGVLQGGFTPLIILYLSYFYKHHELSIRLGFWYAMGILADVVAGFLAFGILHLRGRDGLPGWRWLFLIEGLFTLTLGIMSSFLMPASPTQTAGWARGKKGWFTEREEIIMVNRTIREDPSKGTMHNRQPITPKLLWKSLRDYDLWPLYLIGLIFLVPSLTISQYFTLIMKDLGFGTFKIILLSIPYNALGMVNRFILTYLSEVFQSLALMGLLGQLWMLPMLLYMNIVDITQINKWIVWAVLTLMLCHPNANALQAGWNSRNSNSVRSRAIAPALYNMCTQASGIIASNIYQGWDAPRYKTGNHVLLVILSVNIVSYIAIKLYYMLRNHQRDRKWAAMTEDQRVDYVSNTHDEGNKRLDFRFSH